MDSRHKRVLWRGADLRRRSDNGRSVDLRHPVHADYRPNLPRSPFDPIAELKNEFRCLYADLRNALNGESAGPVEADRPWDAFTDDHVGLMDHLGIDRFMVLGFCIGGPFIWTIIERAGARGAAAVIVQPVGFRPESPNVMYDASLNGWGAEIVKRRPDPDRRPPGTVVPAGASAGTCLAEGRQRRVTT